MDRGELAAWLRLQSADGVGDATARRLLTTFGLPQNIFLQSAAALGAVVSEAQAQALCMLTEDFSRAYHAFVAKQKPVFQGN
jgi:predicted Rossmann fold nucleotide-binding protein DprA/Smf involved in DNA uptake